MPHISKSLEDTEEKEKEDFESHMRFTSSVPEPVTPKLSV
jgi:hypothetical protein|tara:strand:- start:487 stop:606 length:120 start_codon:yes stop_codon:yes gene_type:complete